MRKARYAKSTVWKEVAMQKIKVSEWVFITLIAWITGWVMYLMILPWIMHNLWLFQMMVVMTVGWIAWMLVRKGT